MYTEARIQLGLFHWLYRRGQRWIVPNACELFSTGECDVLSIMKSGLCCEYEIKISRNDFRADAKKGKYELFERRMAGHSSFDIDAKWGMPRTMERKLLTPSFFSYAVPYGLVQPAEVPHFAGLIYTDPTCRIFEVIKKPARIHAEIFPDLKVKIGQKLMYRYWHERQRHAREVTT